MIASSRWFDWCAICLGLQKYFYSSPKEPRGFGKRADVYFDTKKCKLAQKNANQHGLLC